MFTAEVSTYALRLLAAGSPPVFRRWADPRPAPDSGLRTLSRLCPPASGLRPPASGLCSDSALRTPDSGLCPDSLRTATADVDPQSPKSLKTCLPSLVSRKEECSEHQRDEAYKPGASDLRNAAFSDKSVFDPLTSFAAAQACCWPSHLAGITRTPIRNSLPGQRL